MVKFDVILTSVQTDYSLDQLSLSPTYIGAFAT